MVMSSPYSSKTAYSSHSPLLSRDHCFIFRCAYCTPCEIKIIASSNVCHNQNSHNGRPTVVYLAVLFSTVWHLENPTIELFNMMCIHLRIKQQLQCKIVQDTVCEMYHEVLAVSVSNALTFFYQLEEMLNKSKSIHCISVHLTIQCFSQSKKLFRYLVHWLYYLCFHSILDLKGQIIMFKTDTTHELEKIASSM